jgi:hypothetical protein
MHTRGNQRAFAGRITFASPLANFPMSALRSCSRNASSAARVFAVMDFFPARGFRFVVGMRVL